MSKRNPNNLQDMFVDERSIHDAIVVVEKSGAHPLLTEAIIKLQEAKKAVTSYHEWLDEESEKDRLKDSPF
jgi:hypothetical protein